MLISSPPHQQRLLRFQDVVFQCWSLSTPGLFRALPSTTLLHHAQPQILFISLLSMSLSKWNDKSKRPSSDLSLIRMMMIMMQGLMRWIDFSELIFTVFALFCCASVWSWVRMWVNSICRVTLKLDAVVFELFSLWCIFWFCSRGWILSKFRVKTISER